MVNPRAGERGGSFCMNSPAKSKPFAANVDWTDRESMTARVYLDWNASAPLRNEAREAACAALALCGNPSSIHGEGRAAPLRTKAARQLQALGLVGQVHRTLDPFERDIDRAAVVMHACDMVVQLH